MLKTLFWENNSEFFLITSHQITNTGTLKADPKSIRSCYSTPNRAPQKSTRFLIISAPLRPSQLSVTRCTHRSQIEKRGTHLALRSHKQSLDITRGEMRMVSSKKAKIIYRLPCVCAAMWRGTIEMSMTRMFVISYT